ncbi:MAG: histidine kinase [Cryomorphaceae bacterium]
MPSKPRILVLVLILFTAGTFTSVGQSKEEPLHFKYAVGKGLPSNTIVRIFSDSRGMLWLGTDRGLFSFNGETFEAYTDYESQSPLVLMIEEDEQGTIWFVTLDSRIFYLEKGKVRAFSNQPHLEAYPDIFFRDEVCEFKVKSAAEIYVGTRKGVVIIKDGNPFSANEKYAYKPGFFAPIAGSLFSVSDCKQGKHDTLSVDFNNQVFEFPIHLQFQVEEERRFSNIFIGTAGNRFAIAVGKVVYYYDGNAIQSIQLPGYASNSVEFLDDQRFLVGTRGEGAVLIDSGEVVRQFLSGKRIISIEQDFEGGLWFGMNEGGLIYIPSLDIESYLQVEDVGDIPLFYAKDTTLYYVDADFNFRKNKRVSKRLPIKAQNFLWKVSPQMNQGHHSMASFLMEDGLQVRVFVDWDQESFKVLESVRTALSFLMMGSDTIIGTHGSLHTIRTEGVKRNQYVRVGSLLKDQKNASEFWTASWSGIYKFEYNPVLQAFREIENYEEQRQYNHLFYLGNELIASSTEKPLSLYSEAERRFIDLSHLGVLNVITVSSVRDFALLGTTEGLLKVFRSPENNEMKLVNLSQRFGFGTMAIVSITWNDESVFLLTDEHVLKFPLRMLLRPTQPFTKSFIRSVRINDSTRLSFGEGEPIKALNDEPIEVYVSTVGYKNQTDRSFSYRVFPIDDEWRTSENDQILLYGLPAGTHELQVRSQDGSIAKLPLLVANHFYQEPWFIILVTLIFASLVALPFFYRRRIQYIQAQNQSERSKLQVQRLTAQLNPHFVFNALSSIQSYILKNDVRSSNTFLVKFSRHIRQALELSSAEFIPLASAIESTENYLELEQMRLNHSFKYSINIDEKIEASQIMIPVMLLQPYVENAVIHGVSNLEEDGIIQIDVSQVNPSRYVIRIMNNGNGEVSTSGLTNQEGHGYGTKLNMERLHLLNTMGRGHYEVNLSHGISGIEWIVEIDIHLDHA